MKDDRAARICAEGEESIGEKMVRIQGREIMWQIQLAE